MQESYKELVTERDTYRYRLKQDGKIVHYGTTYDLAQREVQHQDEYPGSRIEQVGPVTTREVAQRWLKRKMNEKTWGARSGVPKFLQARSKVIQISGRIKQLNGQIEQLTQQKRELLDYMQSECGHATVVEPDVPPAAGRMPVPRICLTCGLREINRPAPGYVKLRDPQHIIRVTWQEIKKDFLELRELYIK